MNKRAEYSISKQLSATTALTGVLVILAAHPVEALPTGGQVSAGQAIISSSGTTLDINQTSQRVVINWGSFNINPNETVQFLQPSASAIALNRVSGPGASQIDGALLAKGNVWIINPNGVMFGKNAVVNVAGLLATTSNITDSNFMAGNFNFTPGSNSNATISNAGNITVRNAGLAAFVAPNVVNSGVIRAKLGRVALASGDSFTLDLYGDGLINLQASNAITSQLVANHGSIIANGGNVLLTAAAANTVVNSLIDMDGLIEANSIGEQNGTVTLYAEGSNAVVGNIAADKGLVSGSSTVLVSGTISATGAGIGESGGTVEVLGDQVGILSGSLINVSGNAGGGTVRIGGDFHGQGTTPTARETIVEQGAVIDADTTGTGNGGNVAVWSDSYTDYAGAITARGGPGGGNGGYVETSGHVLSVDGTVDASAANGNAGTWLLDPDNVVISSAPSSNTSGDPNFAITTPGSPGVVNTTSIDNDLNQASETDVVITASGSIEVASNIAKTAGASTSLTLNAGTDIVIDTGVSISSNHNALAVTLDADTGTAGGAIVMNAGSSILSNGGNITLGGQYNPSTLPAVGDATYANGITLLGSGTTINAGGGNISLRGKGYNGSYNSGGTGGIGGDGISISSGSSAPRPADWQRLP